MDLVVNSFSFGSKKIPNNCFEYGVLIQFRDPCLMFVLSSLTLEISNLPYPVLRLWPVGLWRQITVISGTVRVKLLIHIHFYGTEYYNILFLYKISIIYNTYQVQRFHITTHFLSKIFPFNPISLLFQPHFNQIPLMCWLYKNAID